jgi:hypothetical protein
MMATRARLAGSVDQDVAVVQGGPAYVDDIERRLQP